MSQSGPSVAGVLRRLAVLHAQGYLTDEEFAMQKAGFRTVYQAGRRADEDLMAVAIQELERLAVLVRDGLLTRDQFDAEKNLLLLWKGPTPEQIGMPGNSPAASDDGGGEIIFALHRQGAVTSTEGLALLSAPLEVLQGLPASLQRAQRMGRHMMISSATGTWELVKQRALLTQEKAPPAVVAERRSKILSLQSLAPVPAPPSSLAATLTRGLGKLFKGRRPRPAQAGGKRQATSG